MPVSAFYNSDTDSLEICVTTSSCVGSDEARYATVFQYRRLQWDQRLDMLAILISLKMIVGVDEILDAITRAFRPD